MPLKQAVVRRTTPQRVFYHHQLALSVIFFTFRFLGRTRSSLTVLHWYTPLSSSCARMSHWVTYSSIPTGILATELSMIRMPRTIKSRTNRQADSRGSISLMELLLAARTMGILFPDWVSGVLWQDQSVIRLGSSWSANSLLSSSNITPRKRFLPTSPEWVGYTTLDWQRQCCWVSDVQQLFLVLCSACVLCCSDCFGINFESGASFKSGIDFTLFFLRSVSDPDGSTKDLSPRSGSRGKSGSESSCVQICPREPKAKALF